MKTTTLNALASTVTLALTLGLASAAQAGDFEDAYPAFAEAQAQKQHEATSQRLGVQAPRPRRNPLEGASTEESRAMTGEDSGSFWLAQQQAKPATTTLARAATIQR